MNEILEVLQKRKEISTFELYDIFSHISKDSIWKHISKLRNEGYRITTVKKKGGIYYYRYDDNMIYKQEKLKPMIHNQTLQSLILKTLEENESVYMDYFYKIKRYYKEEILRAINQLLKVGHKILRFKDEDEREYFTLFKNDIQLYTPKEKKFFMKRAKSGEPLFRFIFQEDEVKIIPIGDIHISSVEDEMEIRRLFEKCRNENIYIALMGDLIENSTKYSIADGVYRQKLQAEEQFEVFKQLAYDYSDIVLFYTQGNHERRTKIHANVDVAKMICEIVHVPYVSGRCFGIFENKNQNYSKYFHASHKVTNAVNFDAKRKGAYTKIKEQVCADIFMSGHNHESANETGKFYLEFDKINMQLNRRFFVSIMCPSHLKYWDSYGDHNCFQVPNNDIFYINIDVDGNIELKLLEKKIKVV